MICLNFHLLKKEWYTAHASNPLFLISHLHFPLLLDPTSCVFPSPQTADLHPPLLRWMQGRHGVGGTAIWPCDE